PRRGGPLPHRQRRRAGRLPRPRLPHRHHRLDLRRAARAAPARSTETCSTGAADAGDRRALPGAAQLEAAREPQHTGPVETCSSRGRRVAPSLSERSGYRHDPKCATLLRDMKQRPSTIRRVLPWISLALGIGSAFYMDRRPERAPLVALAAAAGWLLLA